MTRTPDTLQRLTIVTETFAPEINGVANTLGQLVHELQLRGLQIQLIRPRQPGEPLHDTSGLHTLTLPGLPIPGYRSLRFGLPRQGRIRAALQQFRPQVMYVATEGPLGHAAVSAARQQGIAVVSGFHTNFDQYLSHYRLGWLSGLAGRYLRRFHNRTAATLVPTRRQATHLQQQGFRHVGVLARGVDSQRFHPRHRCQQLRQQWGAGADTPVLLSVGRIAAEKNIALALETWQQVRRDRPDARLVLVGDGPELARIRRHYPEVICTGAQRGEALARHYASGDIFLFPSLTDTFGNVVTEAMASGLAVVSFDYAAAHEHIRHRQHGLLAPLHDRLAFMAAACELVQAPQPLPEMRRAARLQAETLSWSRIADDFLHHLQNTRTGDSNHGTEQTSVSAKHPAVP